jgi:hypothetical protein
MLALWSLRTGEKEEVGMEEEEETARGEEEEEQILPREGTRTDGRQAELNKTGGGGDRENRTGLLRDSKSRRAQAGPKGAGKGVTSQREVQTQVWTRKLELEGKKHTQRRKKYFEVAYRQA